MSSSIFDQFRRSQPAHISTAPTKLESLRVQRCFDDVGSYVQLLNETGEVVEPDYQAYSGAMRNLLRTLQQLRERSGFVIDWENPSAQLYLHQHDYLIDYLRHRKPADRIRRLSAGYHVGADYDPALPDLRESRRRSITSCPRKPAVTPNRYHPSGRIRPLPLLGYQHARTTDSNRVIERQPLAALLEQVSKLIGKHTVREKGKRKSQGQFIVEGNPFVLPQDIAGPFIYQELPQRLETFRLFGAEKLRQYRITTTTPRLNLSLSQGIDFLEGSATVSFGDEQLGLPVGEWVTMDNLLAYAQIHGLCAMPCASNEYVNWLAFFEELTAKAEPLKPAPDMTIFRVSATDQPLIRLLAQDTVLKTMVVKAEGFRMLVATDQLTRFKNRLRELGYLV